MRRLRTARGPALGLLLTSLLSTLVVPGRVIAAPAELVLTNQVPAGKKPSITVTATEAVTGLQLDIERQEDHRSFHVKAGPLKVGDKTELQIGDGKAGRAHWKGKLIVRAASGESTSEVTFESNTGAAGGGLKIGYDRAHLDLEHERLQFTVSRPAATARLLVVTDDGAELPGEERSIAGQRAGQWISIDWKPTASAVLRLELTVKTVDGDAVIARLVPWSVSIPHEEVVFASGEATIQPSEEKKLDASYQKIVGTIDKVRKHEPNLDVRVYIAGHTDTVGSAEDNRKLSQARAKAIARWFRDRGLPMPLYYAGFGEDQPKVKTADNVDEPRNRRVDYVVGVEEPQSGRGHYTVLK
jgi:outer membrane protein OmpA-like peptidoglycan-associated protein